MEKQEEDDTICLDESFFINDNYELTKFTFGPYVLELYCLQAASTDFDLTGQLVWPGAMLMNDYLSKNVELLQGCRVIELGSGVGITGILCSKFCHEVVLTDHNDEVLKILQKNIELHVASRSSKHHAAAEKLDWGNSDHVNQILQNYPGGFDLILGADKNNSGALKKPNCLFHCGQCDLELSFQQSSVPKLFDTVEKLLRIRRKGQCKFILAYVSRAKIMDSMIVDEARRHGLSITEVSGTRAIFGYLEGVIFEIMLQ